MKQFCTGLLAAAFLSAGLFSTAFSQPVPASATFTSTVKPFRILTSGRQVTIKGTQDIRSVMVWTAGGHRIVEQKAVNAPSYAFRITVNEKVFFIMVKMADGNTYSEKLGL